MVIHSPEVFRSNGFNVSIDESRELGSRITLTSLPASKQYTFTVTGEFERLK